MFLFTKTRSFIAAAVFFVLLVSLCCPIAVWADDQVSAWNDALQVQAGSDMSDATEIPLNSSTIYAPSRPSDAHWFKVVLPSSGKLQVVLGVERYLPGILWEITLKNEKNNEIWSHTHLIEYSSKSTYGTIGLPAGT